MGTIDFNKFFINAAKNFIQDPNIPAEAFTNLIETYLVSVSLPSISSDDYDELLQIIKKSKERMDSETSSTQQFNVKIFPAWCDYFKGQLFLNNGEKDKAKKYFQSAKEQYGKVYVKGYEEDVLKGIVGMLDELIKNI